MAMPDNTRAARLKASITATGKHTTYMRASPFEIQLLLWDPVGLKVACKDGGVRALFMAWKRVWEAVEIEGSIKRMISVFWNPSTWMQPIED